MTFEIVPRPAAAPPPGKRPLPDTHPIREALLRGEAVFMPNKTSSQVAGRFRAYIAGKGLTLHTQYDPDKGGTTLWAD